MNSTQYPESRLLYAGYQVSGNANWQTKTFILWTEDPIDRVREHYESFFPSFEQANTVREDSPITFRTLDTYDEYSYSKGADYTFPFVIEIVLLDADHDNRSSALGPYYDDNPYEILDHAPRNGTVILFSIVSMSSNNLSFITR
jgi:hypothetical protein